MAVQLTIKNYRCFASPVTVELSKGLTAFVGINNAGKSAFMRFLLEMRHLFWMIQDPSAFVQSLSSPTPTSFNALHVIDQQEIFSNLNTYGLEFWFDFICNQDSSVAPTKVAFKVEKNFQWRPEIHFANGRMISRFPPELIVQPEFNLVYSNKVIADLTGLIQIMRVLSSALYVGPFRNAINIGAREDYFDIQIGDSFIKRFRALKTGPSKKDNEGIQELTDNIRRIFEFDTLDISPSADDTSLHITVNGKPYKQHELGSGLVQFIVVLANAAIKRPKLILIDEPELNLHPRLQLDFLTTMASYADHGVWFSTHSIRLARTAAERVYSVIRKGDGNSIIRPLEDTLSLAEFLGEMSFSTHRELGFDRLLLVEGPTEVKVMQKLLRKMSKDHKVVLLPLHGRFPDAVELDEVLRITTKVAALIDSERSSEGAALERKRESFLELCRTQNIPAHALNRRATENYFSDRVVKQVLGTNYRGLGPYEPFSNANPPWGKSQNWRLAAAVPIDVMKPTRG
jgi:AAA domain, putative AbiEii toxin, Type IV TA system/AAA ATPase domain